MSKQLHHLTQNKIQAKAAQRNDLGTVWFAALAAGFAGVFYFWGYYFWGAMGSVLTGN